MRLRCNAMTMSIGIISWPHDIHFLAVATALESASIDFRFIQGFDFPSLERQSVEIGPNGTIHDAKLNNSKYSLNEFETIWYRRGHRPGLDHILDENDKRFVQGECEHFFAGTRESLSRANRWVNCPSAQHHAQNKVLQLSVAQSLGVRIPHTLVSNDPDSVERFLSRHKGVIGKTFNPAFWRSEANSKYTVSNTFEMTMENFDPDSIAMAPTIFQERIEKLREWRVCVFGDRIDAFIIFDARREVEVHVDHRVMHATPGRYALKATLPPSVADWIGAIMQAFGLKMGQFDFLESLDGFVFLEVNPGGQFLFLELWNKEAGLLAAFLGFLTANSCLSPSQARHLSRLRFEMTPRFNESMKGLQERIQAQHSSEIEQRHVYID